MPAISKKTSTGRKGLVLLAMLTVPISANVLAQQQEPVDPSIIVKGMPAPVAAEASVMTKGPEIKGIISARNDDKVKVTTADGTSTIVAVNEATKIKGGGLFSGSRKLPPARC